MENRNNTKSLHQMEEILLASIQTEIGLKHKLNSIDENEFKLNSNLIDTQSQILTDTEKELIESLCKMVHFSRRENPINFNRKQEFSIKNQSKDKLKVLLANFLSIPVKRVVTFAQNLPDFTQLEIEERIGLLKEATIGISISASSSLFDSKSNIYRNIISKDGNVYADESNMNLNVMKNVWNEELFTKTTNFLKTLSELCFDEACLALFLSIVLFSNEAVCPKNKEKVKNIATRYSFLLQKYLQWKLGDKAEQVYKLLISKLPELKTLGEMHVSFIQDVDQKQIDNFLLAFIFSKKNLKSNFGVDETSKGCVKYEL
uniref:Nuclear receptor n=1 Tax=Brachionus koreanus TaxID=1199090 RepID=A0A221CB57_9BILA|nr:nuclear receptor [Brachionus koreanus]